MSAISTGIPPLIEQQLLAIEKQVRDAALVRGVGRLAFGICAALGIGLILDGWLDLNGTLRTGMLMAWFAVALGLLWRGLIRPAFRPISLSSIAALIEQQFPELRERLTSLVELRGNEEKDLAPGASTLMQDLLARQTVKALDRLSVDQVASARGSFRILLAGAATFVLLLAPFSWNPGGYGLLWGRFFVPWGNYSWGAQLHLNVVEGDRVVARGTDVNVHVTLIERRHHREISRDRTVPLWLNWLDERGASDSRRLDWDEDSQQFTTTIPHVSHSLSFHVTTTGAKTGNYRVDVSDPPSISQWKLDIEPAAYTGLPAKTLTSVPGELHVPEFTRVQVHVEFNDSVATAELIWPAESLESNRGSGRFDQKQVVEQSIPLKLSDDCRVGTASAIASLTGPFAIRAKNHFGLKNDDPSRMLVVAVDAPPLIKLGGNDEPALVRPDEVLELSVNVQDDFGLTAVELHAETSSGIKKVEALTADERREPKLSHTFVLDLSQFELDHGQIVSYRIRAVDNRPFPSPQEVWTTSRTLMANTSLKQILDPELADAERSLEDELSSLRTELNDTKKELAELHQQTERESLDNQPDTDKSDRLNQLQQAQDELIERLQHLSDRLAARRMTKELAAQTEQIAETDFKAVQEKLEQSKDQDARDQLEPLAKAIDQLGTADRKLQQVQQQLNDLNKLEQDLAEMSKLAQRAERLAEQLEKLEAQQQESASNPNRPEAKERDNSKRQSAVNSDPSSKPDSTNKSQPENSPEQRETTAAEKNSVAEKEKAEKGISQSLKEESQKLADQMNDLLKKHPELLEAARRDQLDQLNDLAEQARKLVEPQERLAKALEEAAANSPVPATRPENAQRPDSGTQPNDPKQTPPSDAKPVESQENTQSSDPAKKANKEGETKTENGTSQNSTKSEPRSPAPEKLGSEQSAAEQSGSETSVAEKPTPSKPTERSAAGKQGDQTAERQEQIAREATQQALDLARETGADSAATKAATDFARKADAAKQQAQTGQLASAAKEAREATASADETARQLNPEGQSDSPQAKQAKKLADQQREAAQKMEQLAPSQDAVQGAQSQGQRRIAEATKRLAEQLDRAAQSLKSTPLNSPQEGKVGEQAEKSAMQAEQAMKQSEAAKQQGDPQLASKAANEAAEKLKQTADIVTPTTPKRPNSPPVPKEVGTQVAQATKKIEDAQKELSLCECDCPNPSGSGKSSSKSGQGSAGQPSAQSQSRQSPDSKPGQSQQNGKPSDQNSQPGKSPGQTSQDAKPGQSPPDAKPGQSEQNGKPSDQNSQPGKSPGQTSQDAKPGQSPPDAKPGQSEQNGKPSDQNPQPGKSPGQTSQDAKPGQSPPDAKPGQSEQNGKPSDLSPQTGKPQVQPSQDGKPGQSPPDSENDAQSSEQPKSQSQIARTAEQFRELAAMLKEMRGEPNEQKSAARSKVPKRPGKPSSNDVHSTSESGEGGNNGSGTDEAADLSHLDAELQQQARHNWGRLPGQLRTEILQGAGKKSHPEYTQRIKSYFDEITKPAKQVH